MSLSLSLLQSRGSTQEIKKKHSSSYRRLVDVIKTRIMQEHGSAVYRGTWQATQRIVHTEGLAGLYKGWFANWMRIGPHTIVAFLILEQLRAAVGLHPV